VTGVAEVSCARRHAAFVVPGSRDTAFYSQIAALNVAIGALPWRRWRPSLHVYFGPEQVLGAEDTWPRWARHLCNVHVNDVPPDGYAKKGNWAQVDATLESAPPDADVLVSLDADTFPVGDFEDVLDRVADEELIAGVMAHYPPPPGLTPRRDWERAAKGRIERPLAFDHAYGLLETHEPPERRAAPFYVNGGVVFYASACLSTLVPLYLELRSSLEGEVDEAFTGQVAATLAVTQARLRTWALPMRYNFPNDPVAARLHHEEAENVVIYHYLRTARYDRHRIFATAEAFDRFLAMPLDGPDLGFQRAVRRVFDARYPFT
jgi:hypothetical protein